MAGSQAITVQYILRWSFALAVTAIAFFAAQLYGDPAPLGRPLPPVPQLLEFKGVEIEETSVVDGKVTPAWLEFLAPQPDGAPPLRYPFNRPDFSIMHTIGTEAIVLPPSQSDSNNTIAIALVGLGQPLTGIKYSKPLRRASEPLSAYVARVKQGLESKGAIFYGGPGEFAVAGYSFSTLEYERSSEEEGLLHHFLYIGPCGPAALVIDFSARPLHVDAARPYTTKVMGSFKPAKSLLKLAGMEDPESGYLEEDPKASQD